MKPMIHIVNAVLILATGTCVATGQILWKIAAQQGLGDTGVTLPALARVFLSLPFLAGGLAYCVGAILWVIQLSRFPLATSFAITAGLVFLTTLAADSLLFSTALSGQRALGGALVLLGIALAALP